MTRRSAGRIAGLTVSGAILLPALSLPGSDAPFTGSTANGPATVSVNAWKSYEKTVINDGPAAAYWKLHDNANATVGGINGSNTGSPTFGGTGALVGLGGAQNKSVALDKQDWITFGDNFDFKDWSPFSVELWFKPSSAHTGYGTVISKTNTSPNPGWTILYNGGTARDISFTRSSGGTVETTSYTGGGFQLTNGVWYHIVGTYDGTTQSFYVNGELRSSTASAYKVPNTTGALTIGAWDTAGSVDEVSIYTTALSARQVRAHYLAGIANPHGASTWP